MEVKRNNVDISAEKLNSIEEYSGYRVKDLVNKLEDELKISRQKAIEKVYVMYTNFDIDTMPIAGDFIDYLKTSKAKEYEIAIIVAITSLIFVSFNLTHVLRIIFGIILLFYLPGYSLLEGLQIEVSSGLEKIILSITLSITLLLFIGLLLNYSPWGLRILPLTITITITVTSLVIIALIRSYRRLGSSQLY